MSKQNIAKLKAKYLEYYATTPIQKYAAMSIGRDEDSIIRWRREDADFADRVQMAKAVYVRQLFQHVKPEFALEKLDKEIFNKLDGVYVERSTLLVEQSVTGSNTYLSQSQQDEIEEKRQELKAMYIKAMMKATRVPSD